MSSENENGDRFVCPLNLWENAAPALATKVHAKSSSQDKIALFLELFHGREDVYARRWYNLKARINTLRSWWRTTVW